MKIYNVLDTKIKSTNFNDYLSDQCNELKNSLKLAIANNEIEDIKYIKHELRILERIGFIYRGFNS